MVKYFCDRCNVRIGVVNRVTVLTESDIEDKKGIKRIELCSKCRDRFHEIVEAFWKGKEIEIKEG